MIIYLWRLFINWTLEYPLSAMIVDAIITTIIVAALISSAIVAKKIEEER